MNANSGKLFENHYLFYASFSVREKLLASLITIWLGNGDVVEINGKLGPTTDTGDHAIYF